MNENKTLKLARVLRGLVCFTFVCNLIALPLVPGMVGICSEGDWFVLWTLTDGATLPVPLVALAVCWQYLFRVWRVPGSAVLTLFLWACGVCTAVILWQAKRVLDTILRGEVFTVGNAENMKRAAVCCFLISAAALARLVWEFFSYDSLAPLFTYNALFIPVFLMGGLLCMVMSALFRQAAALKEENDLTI